MDLPAFVSNEEAFERKNLSYQLFKDLDYSSNREPVSFYRSDFRGSRFEGDTFYLNNFDLADFVANIFLNTEFSHVNFGNSAFKNGYFKKCQFRNSQYGDASFQDCTFDKCIFSHETFRMTIINCRFVDCQFTDCLFDQCSTDSLRFVNCTIIKCEMSTMFAENFEIEESIFRDTYLGACFLGTYLVKNTDLNLLSFKYRGEIVSLDQDFFLNYLLDLKNHGRFFEYLNLSLLMGNREDNFAQDFQQALLCIPSETNPNVQKYNLQGIFRLVEFYAGSDRLTMQLFLQLTSILCSYNPENLPNECQMIICAGKIHLQDLLNKFEFDWNYLRGIPSTQCCTVKIHCRDTSFDTAERKIKTLIESVNEKLLQGYYANPTCRILAKENGSVFVTISTSLLLILMAGKVLRSVHGSICQIRIEQAKTNKEIKLIKESNSVSSFLEKVPETISDKDSDDKKALKIYNALGTDYIIDVVIKFLFG